MTKNALYGLLAICVLLLFCFLLVGDRLCTANLQQGNTALTLTFAYEAVGK